MLCTRVLLTTLLLLLLTPRPGSCAALSNRLDLSWGRMTGNDWEEVLQPRQVEMTDSWLVVAGYARRLGGIDRWLSFEAGGQAVRHYGTQSHWEFNLLGTVRWEPFFWDDGLDTSLAFGLGPSWASDVPEVEIANDGSSRRLLVFWMLELAFSLPEHPQLAIVARLHHRSDAYGLFAEEGGSNAPTIGIVYRF